MNPRFPPRGTPAYWEFIEQWLLKERVDNERQWRLLRGAVGITTGLDPIQEVVSLTFPASVGSGSSGCGSCSQIFVKATFSSGGDTTYNLTHDGGCSWSYSNTPESNLFESGDDLTFSFCGQVWRRSVAAHGGACTLGGGFTLISDTGVCAPIASIDITFVVP